MKNAMFITIQPERNLGITRSQFKAAYSAARRNPVTMGGPGLNWTTPVDLAMACLSFRGMKDLKCSGTAWKLAAIREMDILA